MSIHDLKQRLSDVPGIETLTMIMIAGRQSYNISGKVVALDAAASDIEVEKAIRDAMASDAIAQIPAGTPIGAVPASAEGAETMVPPQAGEASPVSGTSPATDTMPVESEGAAVTSIEDNATPPRYATVHRYHGLIPTVDIIAAPNEARSSQGSAMSVTGAKFAGLNLKAQLGAVRSAMEASQAKMAQALGEMQDAANQHGQLAETIASEAASLKADMAEFTNGGG